MTDLGLGAKVAALARDVQLVEVNATGTLSRLGVGKRVPPPGEEIDLGLGTKIGFVRTGESSFAVVAAFIVRAKTKDATKPFARFVYRCFAKYQNAGEQTDDVLVEFSRTNGMMHLWPYLRAYVQTASAQLGLVPLTLPVFRVQATPVAQTSPHGLVAGTAVNK